MRPLRFMDQLKRCRQCVWNWNCQHYADFQTSSRSPDAVMFECLNFEPILEWTSKKSPAAADSIQQPAQEPGKQITLAQALLQVLLDHTDLGSEEVMEYAEGYLGRPLTAEERRELEQVFDPQGIFADSKE